MYKAYIDRIEDGEKMVILVDEADNKKEFVVDKEDYPHFEAGQWVEIHVEDNTITAMHADEETTKEKESNIQSKMSRLQKKKKSKFKRS